MTYEWNYGTWVLCYRKCKISLVFAYDCAGQFYNSFVSQMEVLRKTWHKIHAIQWNILWSSFLPNILNYWIEMFQWQDTLIGSFIQPFFHVNHVCPVFLIPFKYPFLLDGVCCDVTLENTQMTEWSALAAICDFICPLFGRGFRLLKLLSS